MGFIKQLLEGVGLGLADGALDFGFNQAVMNQQVNHQKELMDYQAQIRHDQWEEENAYNHPALQMARLRQAGLNPALMNGAGVQPTSATLSSTPNAGAPSGANRQSNIAQRMAAISQLLTDERNRGLLSEETRLLAQKVINEKIESDIKAIARDTGYTEQQIREMDREALYEAYYGESVFGGSPRIKNNPITADIDAKRSSSRLSEELATTESFLRGLKGEQIEQNIAESKQRVKTLDAEAKKLLRESESIEQIYKRNDLQDCASSFFGFQVHNLPPTLQQRLMELYTLVVRGSIYPETAIRSSERAIEEYRNKELHIPRSRSYSSDASSNSLYGLRGNSEGYSWSETY